MSARSNSTTTGKEIHDLPHPHRTPQRRPRRRHAGAPHHAQPPTAHGRRLVLPRPCGTGRFPGRQGHARRRPPAHRAADLHLADRRRSAAPRQPGQRTDHSPWPGQPDDRRPRHRAHRGFAARRPAPACRAVVDRAATGSRKPPTRFRAPSGTAAVATRPRSAHPARGHLRGSHGADPRPFPAARPRYRERHVRHRQPCP
ncbi:hypothetical protein SDC9_184116 [bioreactor metagenome]|uniref:Uncharacterized protein n=1 Tax=bioreactor metagenome TaxID=1076179 RepID=A0A645HDJ6_9ZZZZ